VRTREVRLQIAPESCCCYCCCCRCCCGIMDSGINETAADRGYNLSGRHVKRRIRFRHALASRARRRGCQVAGNQLGRRAQDTSDPSQTRKFAAAFHDAPKERERERERGGSIPHCMPKATNTPAGGCKANRFTNARKNRVKRVRSEFASPCVLAIYCHEMRERVQYN